MSKVKLTDTPSDVIAKMSEGNPGAMTFCFEIIHSDDKTDLMRLLHLDTFGIYGSKLYMVWNDICGRDLGIFRLLMLNVTYGKVSKEDLLENLSKGYATPYELASEEELNKTFN